MPSVETRARKARDKIERTVREIQQWKGSKPEAVTVNVGDYLALTEVGWLRDGKLSGTSITIRSAPH